VPARSDVPPQHSGNLRNVGNHFTDWEMEVDDGRDLAVISSAWKALSQWPICLTLLPPSGSSSGVSFQK
jgi:hypothetical protein